MICRCANADFDWSPSSRISMSLPVPTTLCALHFTCQPRCELHLFPPSELSVAKTGWAFRSLETLGALTGRSVGHDQRRQLLYCTSTYHTIWPASHDDLLPLIRFDRRHASERLGAVTSWVDQAANIRGWLDGLIPQTLTRHPFNESQTERVW